MGSLIYTFLVRPRMGALDGLPEDLHHGHIVTFDGDSVELRAYDDLGVEKVIPFTAKELGAMCVALAQYSDMITISKEGNYAN